MSRRFYVELSCTEIMAWSRWPILPIADNVLDCTQQYYLVHEYRSTTPATFKKYYAVARKKKYCFGHTKIFMGQFCKVQNRVGWKGTGERTILEEECTRDKSHSAAYSCKAAASVCPARSPAAGQGAEPSHANIRKINFSPQRTQRLEQKATQAIALWHFTYLWHGAGSPPLPNNVLVLEQPEKKTKASVESLASRYTQIRLCIQSSL